MATALAAATTSCLFFTSRKEGEVLLRRADAIEQRLAVVESALAQEREQLRAEIDRARAGVERIQLVTQEATELLARNSADFGVQVQALQRDVQAVTGAIAEVRHDLDALRADVDAARSDIRQRIDQVARRTGEALLEPSQVPADRADHLALAHQKLRDRDYAMARALFGEYVRRYPDDSQADDAAYQLAASFLAENRPRDAIGRLQRMIDTYPRSEVVDAAMLDMATAFFRAKLCGDARDLAQAWLRRFTRSPLVPRVRELLRQIENAPADGCAP